MVNKVYDYVQTCYSKELQDVANIILYTVRNLMKKFCRKRSKRLEKLLEATPCINKYSRPKYGCMSAFIWKVSRNINIPTSRLRIPYTCW